MHQRGSQPPVAQPYPDQDVRDGGLQSDELDALAGQSVIARCDHAALDRRSDSWCAVGSVTFCTSSGSRRATGRRVPERAGAPEDVITSGRGLGDLKVGGARFVRPGAGRMHQRGEHESDEAGGGATGRESRGGERGPAGAAGHGPS